MDDGGQAVFRHGPRVARAEDPLEEQDRLADAGQTQFHGVVAFENGKAVRLPAQRLDRPPLAVAVGIGLDHRPRPGPRSQRPGQAIVVQERRA